MLPFADLITKLEAKLNQVIELLRTIEQNTRSDNADDGGGQAR